MSNETLGLHHVGNVHFADAFVNTRVCGQGRDFRPCQLCHAHLPLFRGLLCSDERDLLLGHHGLRLDLADELPTELATCNR